MIQIGILAYQGTLSILFLSDAANGTALPARFEVFHEHYWQSHGVASKPHVFDEHTVISPEINDASETSRKKVSKPTQRMTAPGRKGHSSAATRRLRPVLCGLTFCS